MRARRDRSPGQSGGQTREVLPLPAQFPAAEEQRDRDERAKLPGCTQRGTAASRRMGSSAPRAVEHKATPMITGAAGDGARRRPAPTPAAKELTQPAGARLAGRPRPSVKSISLPAAKKSMASPNWASVSVNSADWIHPIRLGPSWSLGVGRVGAAICGPIIGGAVASLALFYMFAILAVIGAVVVFAVPRMLRP